MTVVTATTGGNGLKDNLPGGRTSNALYITGIGKGGTGSGTARTASVAGTADGGHGMVIIQWGDPPTARPDSATGAASTAIVTAVATNDSIARQQQRQCQVKEPTRSIRQLVKSHSSVLLDM
jgi:hypothetical protein